MPRQRHRRGSFADHLDELVKHFPHDHEPAERKRREPPDDKDNSRGNGLFGRAWRKARGD